MANPFDILPSNLFNLPSVQGRNTMQRHYIAILLRLYSLAEFNRVGLTREVAVADIVDYLRNAGEEAEIAAEIEASLDGSGGEAVSSIGGQKSAQDYASYLLRRLAETGWIERMERRMVIAPVVMGEGGRPVRSIKVRLDELGLPGYYS